MNSATRERLFGFHHAFDHPVTLAVTIGLAAILLVVPLVLFVLARLGRIEGAQRQELWRRYYSWLVMVPLLLGPILAGAAWTILGIGVLSLFCYREYARATGLFREKLISLVVVIGIVAVTLTVLDHWYGLFVALTPYTVGLIACAALLRDEPQGYIQRVALGILGFVLFGSCFGHLAYLANDASYRPCLVLVLVSVELNDVFAFLSGKTLGKRKLAPKTSPNKTLGGALGALVLTTLLVAGLGHYVFQGTALARPEHLFVLGVLISLVGQFGDLMLSAIKRDLGIKDMGMTIPGHGGLLDRFDSIILVSPLVFHYINYFVGVGLGQTPRIFSGG
ncbi:MAG: phosphatidate cytidylyltransferase [Candidatus Hydrogenedentes bacterium]|nr:phosphatidate cytidylyltransferase [Candidatus Hydrogenedentota bacterium]